MAELFGFTKHLRSIVTGALREKGFSQKGAHFIRKRGAVTDDIWFQRSQWNDTRSGDPLKFYLNLYCGTGKEPFRLTDIRLPHPAKVPFPSWWLALTPDERGARRKVWKLEEQAAVEHAARSSDWLYASEAELCELLRVAVNEILHKGIPYLEAVSDLLNDPQRDQLIKHLKEQVE